MSSGEDDAPLSDESEPEPELSYDGYKDDTALPDESDPSYDGYKQSSSEEEQGDAPVYPLDDTVYEDDIRHNLSSKDSFPTDRFPVQLPLQGMDLGMGRTLQNLNNEACTIFEESRLLINQLYRTDEVLKGASYMEWVWKFKNDCYTDLLEKRQRFEACINKISILGGPYYNPPAKLWEYLHFFWYDSSSCSAGNTDVTPDPPNTAPNFHNQFFCGVVDLGLMVNTLKEEDEEFVLALGEENTHLMADLKTLSQMVQNYWENHRPTTSETDGFYVELMKMEEETKEKFKTGGYKFPYLLHNILVYLKKEKNKEKDKDEKEKDTRTKPSLRVRKAK